MTTRNYTHCRALKAAATCGSLLTPKDKGGVCADCWHPQAVEQLDEYQVLRKDGYTREEAIASTGIEIYDEIITKTPDVLVHHRKKQLSVYLVASLIPDRSTELTWGRSPEVSYE